jgi:hypothetical protein
MVVPDDQDPKAFKVYKVPRDYKARKAQLD